MFLKTYFLPDYAEQVPAPGYTAEEVSTTSKYVCICVEILLKFSTFHFQTHPLINMEDEHNAQHTHTYAC